MARNYQKADNPFSISQTWNDTHDSILLDDTDSLVSDAFVSSSSSSVHRAAVADDYATVQPNSQHLPKTNLFSQEEKSKKRQLGEIAAMECFMQQPKVKSCANAKHSTARPSVDQGSSLNREASNFGSNMSTPPNEWINIQSSSNNFDNATTSNGLISTSSSLPLAPFGNQNNGSALLAPEKKSSLERTMVDRTFQKLRNESYDCGGDIKVVDRMNHHPHKVFGIGDRVEVQERDDTGAWEIAEVVGVSFDQDLEPSFTVRIEGAASQGRHCSRVVSSHLIRQAFNLRVPKVTVPAASEVTTTNIATNTERTQRLDKAMNGASASPSTAHFLLSAMPTQGHLDAPAHLPESASIAAIVSQATARTAGATISATALHAQKSSETSPQEYEVSHQLLASESTSPLISPLGWRQPHQTISIGQEATTGIHNTAPTTHEAVRSLHARTQGTAETFTLTTTTRAADSSSAIGRSENTSVSMLQGDFTNSSAQNDAHNGQYRVRNTRSNSSEISNEWGWFNTPDSPSES